MQILTKNIKPLFMFKYREISNDKALNRMHILCIKLH